MKRLTAGILFLIVTQLFLVAAYDTQVDSFSESEVVLSLTGLNTVDVKLSEVTATVEGTSLSDTYVVDATLEKKGEKILIHIDVSPIFQDYSSEQIKSITVSGMIDVAGETTEFGKRVPLRGETTNQRLAAPGIESSTLLYWVLALCIILVIVILVIFFMKPKGRVVSQRISKKRKVKKKKSVTKKKKNVKMSKKRW